jgi:RND family efflux transporter MFP subunit
VALMPPAMAEPMRFSGTVEAAARAEVNALVDGVVRAVHVRAGEAVREGQLLFEIEPVDDLQSRLRAARAAHDRRLAELADRRLVLDRQTTLRARDATSELRFEEAGTAVAVAEAEVAAAAAAVVAAERALARTRLRAPIAGVVDRPRVAPGAFVEAEAGAPLAVVARLDPVHVVYEVPYAERLEALAETRTATVDDLLDRLQIRLVLPNGVDYPHAGRPFQSNNRVDPATGALKTWAEVANPDQVLLPGLTVEVRSVIAESP